MKKWLLYSFFCLLLVLIFLFNKRYEIIALNFCKDNASDCDISVLTWNIKCSNGETSNKQRQIAEILLKQDVDVLLLNEIYIDSCLVIDSLLKQKYLYSEEEQAHEFCGDIIYSKYPLYNSGHIYIPVRGKSIQTIQATVITPSDSVQIYGCHLASNSKGGTLTINGLQSLLNVNEFYNTYKDRQSFRCYQIEWLKKNLPESQKAIIVMGDLNDVCGTAPLDSLKNCGLIDSWWEGGFGYGTTYHEGWLRLRIDHICYNDKLKLRSVKVIDTDLSDHNLLIAGFSIK